MINRYSVLACLLCALPPGSPSALAEQPQGASMEERMRALQARLGFDGRTHFRLTAQHRDELGMTHARFQQHFQGLKVWGGEVILHVDAQGRSRKPTLACRRGVEVATEPGLGPSEVLAAVIPELPSGRAFARPPQSELVVLPEGVRRGVQAAGVLDAPVGVRETGESFRLAYHLRVTQEDPSEGPSTIAFLVDAQDGTILRRWRDMWTGGAEGAEGSGTLAP